MYQMKRFVDMEHSLCLPVCFCFYQLGLCSVSYTANEYSIYHFCIIKKAVAIRTAPVRRPPFAIRTVLQT